MADCRFTLDQTSRVNVVPGFGFNYISSSGRHRWIFTFPQIGYLHQPSDSFFYGVFAQYENLSFNLNPKGSFATNSEYEFVAIERATTGLIARYRIINSGFWLTGRIGYTFWGETALLKKQDPRELREKIQEEGGLTNNLTISYTF